MIPIPVRSRFWSRFGHSVARVHAAWKSAGLWPSFSREYARVRNQSYVLILLYVTHGLRTSMRANPLCWMPFVKRSARPFASPLKPRAMYVAPDESARARGFTGFSITPSGVDFVFMSFSLVGLAWPVVRP